MLFRDLGIAHLETTAARRINQRPSLVARRVLERRAAGAASKRLRFLASAGDRIHLRADRLRVAGCAAEDRLDHHRTRGNFAMTVGVAELFEGPFDRLA